MGIDRLRGVVLAVVVLGLGGGLGAYLLGAGAGARLVWGSATIVALVPLAWEVARDLARGKTGVDVIALLAMGGALFVGEVLAGAVIALMLSGGQVLESHAGARARRELVALADRAPRSVNRYEDGNLVERDVEDVAVGDLLLVRTGDVIPVDGVVTDDAATVDESALTGEPLPVERVSGDQVRSGTTNAGVPFRMRAIAAAEASTYAGVLRLVREAEASKAPFVRLADRYAAIFLPVTVIAAAVAWAAGRDPVRAVAVLVVATPCPLILAAPIAIVAGVSRAAHRGIVVKGGAALEALARGEIVLFDKTGTLTAGTAALDRVETVGALGPDDVLRLSASLEQVSAHVLASSIVAAARERGMSLSFPGDVEERPGTGIRGTVDGRSVAVGRAEWASGPEPLPQRVRDVRRRAVIEGASAVFVAVDGALAGVLLLTDHIRPDAARAIRSLRRGGIEHIVMVTGDAADVAESVGAAIGIDEVYAERDPADKVDVARAQSRHGLTVMVGDGINDAPALAASDVGVAMSARGASASSEAADVVLMVDRLDRLVEARRIATRSRRIALQSVVFGMALSVVAMGFAAAGFLPPVAGALLQEGIDVAVIVNALRGVTGGRQRRRAPPGAERVGGRARAEHATMRPQIESLRTLADRLDVLQPEATREELERAVLFLTTELLPHEEREDQTLYPIVAEIMGGDDPTEAMTRAHVEIAHRIRTLTRTVTDLPPSGPSTDDVRDLRRILYGLHAVLLLHIAQEEEAYLAMIEERTPGVGVDG